MDKIESSKWNAEWNTANKNFKKAYPNSPEYHKLKANALEPKSLKYILGK
ncbi:MAG: hypothetical protein IPJ23_03860 [Ignavibacteriales bacterium]|nr:hypothetical protein [Ignavibacteriales bacterium]